MEAASFVAASALGIDRAGRVETRGVDFIPESERRSRPRDLAWVFFGGQLCYGSILVGSLPVAWGLSWWGAFSSILVGSLLGSLGFAVLAVMGPKAGTNATVTSCAFFGIRGRYVGSLIIQVITLGFFALQLWVSTPPLIAAAASLWGTPSDALALTIGLAVVTGLVLLVNALGHATLVMLAKLTAVTNVFSMAALVVCAASAFHGAPVESNYLLGGFWPTWALATMMAISNAISYAPFAGDYTRYMSVRTSGRALFGWGLFGMVTGTVISLSCGAFIALALADAANVLSRMVAVLPTALLLPVVLAGLIGNVTNAGLNAYNGTLDLHALLWRLRRVQVSFLFGGVGIALGWLGLVAFDMTSSTEALCSLVTVLVTPWIAINVLGYWRGGGRFAVADLQAFDGRRGAYWYQGGYNLRAILAWVVGVVVGLLFAGTDIFTGPLANLADGVDLSFLSSAVVSSVLYLLMAAKPADPSCATL
jgi:purine-cytosine permease-like protein